MTEQEQTPVPAIPDPEKLANAGGLTNQHKRWIFFGVLGTGVLIVLANIATTPANKPVIAKAATASAIQQQQNPTPAQLTEWEHNLTQAERNLKAEAQRQEAMKQPTATPGVVTAADLYSAQSGAQDPRLGPSAQQASEAEQQKAQLKAEREALAYKSLFADSRITQQRAEQAPRVGSAGHEGEPEVVSPGPSAIVPGLPATPEQGDKQSIGEAAQLQSVSDKPAADKRKPLDFIPTKQPTFWLPEGTVIEGVLTNKLNGDEAGPVNVMISANVYLPGTRLLLIPQGARVLGEASKVSSFGQARLAVAFHRVLVPGLANYSIPLDKVTPGLAQAGEVGLRGKVNSHYASIFGASLAVGAIGGLAQIGNTGSYSSMGEFRNGVSQSTAQSADRILDRFLNRLPTLQIPEGTRVRVLLTDDLQLPSYDSMHTGGI